MELHAPEGPIRSLKDFVIHLCVVTVGILIALGLEQLVEMGHRATLARDAIEGFRHELSDDRAQVKEVMASMPGIRGDIKAELDELLGTASTPGAPRRIHYPGIQYNSVSIASWETALVTQGLAELPYATVKRYSNAYDILRLFLEQERSLLSSWHEMRAFGEDAAALTPDQRRELVERLRRYDSLTYSLEFVGKSAVQECDTALELNHSA